MAAPAARRVVLIGAGHAHLHVARNAGAFARRGIELVLVDPGAFAYSGLATGVLGGMYTPEEDRVDAKALIERSGGRFVRDRAVALDRDAREVVLAAGGRLPYDAASLNVGSEVALERIPRVAGPLWTVKPIPNLWRLREWLEARFRETPGRPVRAVVVGGGATGCEVAANLNALARLRGGRAEVVVISDGPRLIEEHSQSAARTLARALARRGIELCLGCEIERVEGDAAVARDGRRFPADLVVAATGLRPPAWNRTLGLPVGDAGGLRVGPTLQSVGDERVFGAGDCIRFEERALPKLGVFAVREGPILLRNLLALVEGAPLERYRPQKRYLSILNLGQGDALAVWGPLYWRGRAAMRWKDRLDRRFLERYRAG